MKRKNSLSGKAADELVEKLKKLKNSCAVCDKMGKNMDKLPRSIEKITWKLGLKR